MSWNPLAAIAAGAQGLANAIANALWNIFLANISKFISNTINTGLPYIVAIITLVIIVILVLRLF